MKNVYTTLSSLSEVACDRNNAADLHRQVGLPFLSLDAVEHTRHSFALMRSCEFPCTRHVPDQTAAIVLKVFPGTGLMLSRVYFIQGGSCLLATNTLDTGFIFMRNYRK
jgi:hypothetical protein